MRKQKAEVGKVYRKALDPEVRSIDEKARTIEFVASTESVDRYGDVIRVAGWKLDSYKKNPVFLWAHKSSEPPIGKTVEVRTEANPPALVQKVEFASKDVYPFADTIYNLYRGGYLRAVSVGFMPTEEPKAIRDANNDARTGWEFVGQELLELSAVPVPANPEAVARMVSKGFGTESDLGRVFSGPNMEAVYRELISIHQEIASIAVDVATKAMRQSHAALEAARGAERGEVALEELLENVKLAGSAVQEAPEPEIETDEITTLDQLARAVGSEDEPATDDEVFSDSRVWRTGKLSIHRELR